eukprot:20779-Heterococcus_DN1.PRE.1
MLQRSSLLPVAALSADVVQQHHCGKMQQHVLISMWSNRQSAVHVCKSSHRRERMAAPSFMLCTLQHQHRYRDCFERGPLKGAFFATSSFALSFAFSRSPPPPCWNLASAGTPASTKRGHGRVEERGKHQKRGSIESLTSNELFGTI